MSETTTQTTAQQSGSFNPNVPVTDTLKTDGKIEASGGAVTFDDLDQVLSQDGLHNKRNKPKNKDFTSDDKKVDSKNAEKSEKSEAKAQKSEDKPEKTEQKPAKNDKKDEQDPEKPPRKTVKGKYKKDDEDIELDIDEETEIPVIVNGREEMWSIKDLRQQQSGKIAYDKKFQELDKERQGVRGDRAKLEASAKMIKDAMMEKDQHLKIYKIAKIAGVDPVQFRQQWMKDQLNYLENYYAMNDSERAADDSAYVAKFQQHRADTLEGEKKEQQATNALLQKIDQIRASQQIDEDSFWTRHDELEAQVRIGKLKESELTPEYIAHTIMVDRYWDPASEALDKLNLDWSDERRGQELTDLVKSAMALAVNPAKMAELVDQKFGVSKAKKKVETKTQENNEFKSGKPETIVHKTKSEDEPIFFHDM